MLDQKDFRRRAESAADVFPICRWRPRDHAGSLAGEQKSWTGV